VTGRLFTGELALVRRSPLLAVTLLLAVGGTILARLVAWTGALLESSEVGEIVALAAFARDDLALPLSLLAYILAAAYLFGRDFDNETIDYALTAPIPREGIVTAKLLVLAVWVGVLASLAWIADALTRQVLVATSIDPGALSSLPSALLVALAALSALPLVAWAAVRLRGTIAALGLGIGIQLAALLLGGLAGMNMLPWRVPVVLAAGEPVSIVAIAGCVLLAALGAAACVIEMRRMDLV
jgi:ABC-type transport system involved in multi-copper enzyme maturation permease subunit